MGVCHTMQKQEQIIHYPRLDTVLMIEEAIKKAKEYPSKRQLWLSLPKQVMYQTFNLVLDYLQESNKIHITKSGKIIWIWDPEGVKKYLKRKDLVVR
jgi:hypothetical protein